MAFLVPFLRNPKFVGRDTVLENIESKHGVTILQGPSGIGKSQVAIEHAYRSRALRPNDAVIWLAARGFWRLSQSVKETVRSLSLSRPDIVSVSALIRWLQEVRGNWLLVLDDISFESYPEEEKSQLLESLKTLEFSSGRVLATSTIGEWEPVPSNFDIIQLPNLSREESLQFFSRRLVDTNLADREKSSIFEALDCHVLALQLASSYLLESEETAKSAEALRALKSGRQVDAIALEENTSLLVCSVLDLTLSKLKEVNQSALELLYLASLLDMQGIPITLLTLCHDTLDENWRVNFRRAIRKLLSFSLIQSSSDQFTLFLDEPTKIHVLRKLESDKMLAEWQRKAVQVLSDAFPDGDSIYWRQCETLLPHTHTVLNHQLSDDGPQNYKLSHATLLRKIGKYNQAIGNYSKAHDQKIEALTIYQSIYGENALKTLEVEKEVAGILYIQGKVRESEAKFIDILRRCQAHPLPENHYLLFTHYNSLAAVAQDLGKLDEAEKYAQKAIQGYEETYGSAHADTLISKWNLAKLYKKRARYKEAHKLFMEILEAYRKTYDETHPDILETTIEVATTLLSLSDHDGAIKMLQAASNHSGDTLSPTHPVLLRLQNTLAMMYLRLGRDGDAESQFRTLVEKNKLVHGENGEQRLVAMNNLGGALQRQKKYADAVEVQRDVLKRCKEALGQKGRLTMRAGNNLAESLRLWAEGGVENAEELLHEAEDLHRGVLKLRTEVLGEALDTWISTVNLGTVLLMQGGADEARECFNVLERLEGAAGSQNEVVKRCKERLAWIAKERSEARPPQCV